MPSEWNPCAEIPLSDWEDVGPAMDPPPPTEFYVGAKVRILKVAGGLRFPYGTVSGMSAKTSQGCFVVPYEGGKALRWGFHELELLKEFPPRLAWNRFERDDVV